MTRTVIEYLERAAAAHPDKVAFADAAHEVTYGELLDLSHRVATALLHEVEGHNRPIAVLIDRNVESVCAFMGILTSRNFYVPIDVNQPARRIETIIAQMMPSAVVRFAATPEVGADLSSVPVLEYESLAASDPDLEALAQARATCLDIDPCYAICTSGSTGVPKGVLVSHRSVIDFIPVFTRTFGLGPDEVFGNQAPFDFDVSVKDVYSTLFLGATTHIIPRQCFSMPKQLISFLNERRVTTLVWAVSALCVVSAVNGLKREVPQQVRTIMFSGETMPIKALNYWRDHLPEVTYVNLYGPTEITCNCMYYVLDRDFALDERLPLGVAFDNEEVLVLDDEDRPVVPGGQGEICVVGTCLALGYYNDPERTARAFVQNPLDTTYPQLMYRTGDIARLEPDGQYYFAARKDFQIKHMGHRIELEEIELHLNAVDGVTRACCLFDDVRNKIVAFYQGDAQAKDIARALGLDLPKYMIPNVFRQVDALPISKNGKIDRQAIRRAYEEQG